MVRINQERSQEFDVRKLHRSRNDRMFLGVLGGLAEYFKINSTLLRLIFLVFVALTGFFPGVLIYLFAGLVMSEDHAR